MSLFGGAGDATYALVEIPAWGTWMFPYPYALRMHLHQPAILRPVQHVTHMCFLGLYIYILICSPPDLFTFRVMKSRRGAHYIETFSVQRWMACMFTGFQSCLRCCLARNWVRFAIPTENILHAHTENVKFHTFSYMFHRFPSDLLACQYFLDVYSFVMSLF